MRNKRSLILIGKQFDNQELQITYQRNTLEGDQLTDQPHTQTKIAPYPSIPLENNTILSIQYHGYHVQLDLVERSLIIMEGKRKLTEEEAFNMLANFAIKEGDRVSFLGIQSYRKTRPRKRKKERSASEGKVMTRN